MVGRRPGHTVKPTKQQNLVLSIYIFMKTVGIIGGMGPEATAQLQMKIINKFIASGQKHRPDILVSSVPVNLEAEKRLITNSDNGDFSLLLVNAAIKLENGGADFIVIACNTVHLFIESAISSVIIPVFSVIEETKTELVNRKITQVGILATSFTVENKLFEFDGVELKKPDIKSQLKLTEVIDKLAKGETVDTNIIENILEKWINEGVDGCILACSELQLLGIIWNRFENRMKFIDTMDILANKVVNNLVN